MARAKNIISERQNRAEHSSEKADVCDGITMFQAFYHFPRVPLCVNSAKNCDRAPLVNILMIGKDT